MTDRRVLSLRANGRNGYRETKHRVRLATLEEAVDLARVEKSHAFSGRRFSDFPLVNSKHSILEHVKLRISSQSKSDRVEI